MTVTLPHPAENIDGYTVRDDNGRGIGAVRHYPERRIWTVTVGSRVVSLYPRRGRDDEARAEAARLAGVLAEHPGMRCRVGLYPGIDETCRCPQ